MHSLNPEAKQLFDEHVKGKNILTPNIIGYGVAGQYAYELSEGTDMDGDPMYGVTVLLRSNGDRRCDLSKCFSEMSDAENHISKLRSMK